MEAPESEKLQRSQNPKLCCNVRFRFPILDSSGAVCKVKKKQKQQKAKQKQKYSRIYKKNGILGPLFPAAMKPSPRIKIKVAHVTFELG